MNETAARSSGLLRATNRSVTREQYSRGDGFMHERPPQQFNHRCASSVSMACIRAA